MNVKRRVALYIRVSTQEQADKYGSDVQLNQMKKWVEAHDDLYELNEENIYIDEGFSGASEIEEREAMPKLFQAARKKEFDVILVWKLDRFFRKTRYLLNAIEELRDMGIGFIATTQTEINTTSTMGKFMLGLLGIIAEMERDLILERTGVGRVEAASQGKWVGGMHSYGYDIDPKTQEIAVNPTTSKIVRTIFRWFVRDRLNTYEIQKRLNAMAIPTQADLEASRLRVEGKLKKSKRTVNPENYWHDKTVRRILKNDAYTGIYYYNKTTRKLDQKTKKRATIINPREEWVEIPCPQIIDRETWEDAQELLRQNELAQKRGKRRYMLSAKVTCGLCGSAYQAYMKGKIKTKQGVREKVAEYPYYRCCKISKSKTGVLCHNRQVSGSFLEKWVWGKIEELMSDPENFIHAIEAEERKQTNIEEVEQERDIKQKELDDTNEELDRVMVLFQRGLKYQGKGELEKETSKHLARKKKLEKDLNAIAAQLMTEEERRGRLTSAKSLAKKYAHAIKKKTDFEMQRSMVQDLVNRVVVFPNKLRCELLIPRSEAKKNVQNEDVYGATGRD